MNRKPDQTIVRSEVPDALKHLAVSLKTGWKRYRKRLRRCQKSFSEDAVHDSRVETRRLLATIELLGPFIPARDLKKACRALKHHLDTFDQLRDTQVQLDYVKRMERTFPAAHAFRDWLRKREARFTRRARRAIKGIKTKRLGRRVRAFETEMRRQHKQTSQPVAFGTVLHAMNRAFGRVAQFCRRVEAEDTATIHRTRIAFKRFRYMVEALSPLLPVVTDDHRRAMRGYQSMMGDIQDVEVLLAALGKFTRRKEINAETAHQLQEELMHRRRWLIRVYLNAAGRLRQFWPPTGLDVTAQKQNPNSKRHEPLHSPTRNRH